MKQMKCIVALLLAAMAMTACSNDGDVDSNEPPVVTPDKVLPVEISGSGDVDIDKNNINGLALTLYWTDDSRLVNTLQFAATSAFETPVEIQTAAGTTAMQFTAESLNVLAGRVGLKNNVSSALYIRMRSVQANDTEPLYSNVYQVLVTPFSIDTTLGYVLDADKNDTGCTLISPHSDGVYCGFLAASSWYNWWLREDNGTLWGNVGNDGGGKAFAISSNNQHWNFWFPEPAGCYYTIVNTVSREWSALYIPSLTVSGDLSGEMAYDPKANKWTYAFEATQAGSVNIQIAGAGEQYTVQTGTENPTSTPVAFGMANGALTFGSEPSTISVSVLATGKVTLTLDLADPKEWACTIR